MLFAHVLFHLAPHDARDVTVGTAEALVAEVYLDVMLQRHPASVRRRRRALNVPAQRAPVRLSRHDVSL